MKNNKLAKITLGLLVLQYLLGMLANLYSTIPSLRPWEVFHQLGFILFHAINGTILVILSAVILVKNVKAKKDIASSIWGFLAIVLAFACGEYFVFTQIALFSLLMSLLFLVAFVSYIYQIFINKN